MRTAHLVAIAVAIKYVPVGEWARHTTYHLLEVVDLVDVKYACVQMHVSTQQNRPDGIAGPAFWREL